jgi:large repetitive protein
VRLNGATITNGASIPADLASANGFVPPGDIIIDTIQPAVVGISFSPGSGDVGPGGTVTVTLNFNEAVTVAGGTPTITLNNGGTATYASGSGTSALAFTYTVGAANGGQLTSYLSLAPNAVSLNGATITNGAGTTADVSAANGFVPPGDVIIDTIKPAVVGISFSPGSGDVGPGGTVTVTLNFNEAVTVAGGTPTIALNNGGVASYTGGSGTAALTFTYTVGAANSGQLTSYLSLAPNAVSLNGATIQNGAGSNADLSAASGFVPSGDLTVDTILPAITYITESPPSGDVGPGSIVTFTVHFNEAVSVAGGTPTIALNNGGVASYTGGSGTAALTFTYTVGAANSGQLTSYLSLAPNAVSLNGATIENGAGTNADLSAANGFVPPGDLIVDTILPAITRITESPPSGDIGPGSTVTFTLYFNEAVAVSGGPPTITLNNGGVATYSGGSGTAVLTFTYTVGAAGSGQNTAWLQLAPTAVNLDGGTIQNGAGTNADLSAANAFVPPGQLMIDDTLPVIASIVENPYSGTFGPGDTITFTVNFNEAVTVAGGTPSIALNDGGTATYTSGSGTSALVFTYTVGALGSGQNTQWLSIAPSGITLNGASIQNGVGTAANLSGANGFVPGGDVAIDTDAPGAPSWSVMTTPIQGTGTIELAGSNSLEFEFSDTENVAFAPDATGTLKIDHSLTDPFTGSVSGLTTENRIDLADLAWEPGKMTASFSGNTAGGVLTVSNGSGSVQIDLSGNYTSSTWTLSEDPSGGTYVVDPPAGSGAASSGETNTGGGHGTGSAESSSGASHNPEVSMTGSYEALLGSMQPFGRSGSDDPLWQNLVSNSVLGANAMSGLTDPALARDILRLNQLLATEFKSGPAPSTALQALIDQQLEFLTQPHHA